MTIRDLALEVSGDARRCPTYFTQAALHLAQCCLPPMGMSVSSLYPEQAKCSFSEFTEYVHAAMRKLR